MKREILHGSGGLKGIGRCSREAFHADPENGACDAGWLMDQIWILGELLG
jgi:hypothetical protein